MGDEVVPPVQPARRRRMKVPAVIAILLASASYMAPDGAAVWLSLATWAVCLISIARIAPHRVLSLPFLYLLLLGLFHLGLVVPAAVGLGPEVSPRWLESPYLPGALRLVTLASAAFTVGAIWGTKGRHASQFVSLSERSHPFWAAASVAALGFGLLAAGVVQLGLLFNPYADYWERALSEDVRLFGFGMLLFPMGLLLAAVWATDRQMRWVVAAYVATFGPLLVVGFRGHAIVHGVALLVVWHRKAPVVAKRAAAVAAVAIVLLSPVVRLARSWEMSFSDAMREAHPLDFMLEAGGSLRPLVETAALIESGAEPLWHGDSYAQGFTRLVPNIGTSPSRTEDPFRRLPPNHWITLTVDPGAYARGGGMGFSGVAEPFLNFGVPGVAFVFMVTGVLLARLNIRTNQDLIGIVSYVTFGFVLWTVRNDTTGLPRTLIYATVIVSAIRFMTYRRRWRMTVSAR